jgi:hypothetical protein
VIFVTSVESPLSEAEEGFLQDIRGYVRKLFILVNKIDLLVPAELDDVLTYIQQGVERALGSNGLRIYPLSAQLGLIAKQNRDMTALRASGLPGFEQALTSYLSEELARIFLVASLDRALRIFSGSNRTPALQALHDQMETLHSSLLNGAALSTDLTTHKGLSESAGTAIDEAIDRSRSKSSTGNKQRTSGASGRCPICTAQSQAVFEFFVHWQYTFMRSEAARQALADSRGFCPVHTWQFEKIASPMTVSEGFVSVVEAQIAQLYDLLESPAKEWANRLERLPTQVDSCAACRILKETENEQIQQFLTEIAEDGARERYARSLGLCLPHLDAVIATCTDQEISRFLIGVQIRTLEQISEDMRSFTLKREVLRRDLLNSDETNAWVRALAQLVGERTARIS